MTRRLATAALAVLLAGCAAQPLYQWGGYEPMLYASYKDPTKAEAFRTGLERHIAELEKNGGRVAPGLNAEVGTLYLQAGATDKALQFYRREHAAWPESRPLMDSLITNIEKRARDKVATEGSK